MTTKKDGWRDQKIKMREVRFAVEEELKKYGINNENETHRIFELVKNQRDY